MKAIQIMSTRGPEVLALLPLIPRGRSQFQYHRAAPEGSRSRVPVDLKNFESCFEEQRAIPERLN